MVHQPVSLYKRHRFPGEVISHAVWLYFRFLLSYRDVEEVLAERGIAVSYETVRRWCVKFGQSFADGVRRRRPRPGDKWPPQSGAGCHPEGRSAVEQPSAARLDAPAGAKPPRTPPRPATSLRIRRKQEDPGTMPSLRLA
jgi:hypothetical protein